MGMVTALDKFYKVFDNPKGKDLFFDYNGLTYQLSYCGRYILTWRTEDCGDEWEYCIPGDGKEFIEAILNAKVNQTKDKSIREILTELPPDALVHG